MIDDDVLEPLKVIEPQLPALLPDWDVKVHPFAINLPFTNSDALLGNLIREVGETLSTFPDGTVTVPVREKSPHQ